MLVERMAGCSGMRSPGRLQTPRSADVGVDEAFAAARARVQAAREA